MNNPIDYAIVVKSKTRLEALTERFNTQTQASFYIERNGGSFEEYEQEHEQYQSAFSLVQRQLSSVVKNKVIDRSFLPSFLFNEKQVVVVVGQDGLVANTAKYVGGIPIVAVNPDPSRYDGVLLPFRADNFAAAVQRVVSGRHQVKDVAMAEARLNDGQRLLAFNDLFIGASSHISARYRICYGGQAEDQSSSGIIVSTKAGATGWLSSIFNMASGIKAFLESQKSQSGMFDSLSSISKIPSKSMKKGGSSGVDRYELADSELLFVVREAFQSKRTQAGITVGVVNGNAQLVVESFMPQQGVIFSDGIESDFIRFNSGAVATIGIAPERARLVVG